MWVSVVQDFDDPRLGMKATRTPSIQPQPVTYWDHASTFEVVADPRVLFVHEQVIDICLEMYRVLRVITTAVKTGRCHINHSSVVDVSTAF